MRVYCEHGALTSQLRAFRRESRVELIHFPYDENAHSRYIDRTAVPSEAQYRDLNLTYGELRGTYGDFSGSERLKSIRAILGSANRRDALHVDSAYKSRCNCFITRDRGILIRAEELEALLGLRFFHPDEDWKAFVEFLESSEKGPITLTDTDVENKRS
jgi:hypothetical protein